MDEKKRISSFGWMVTKNVTQPEYKKQQHTDWGKTVIKHLTEKGEFFRVPNVENIIFDGENYFYILALTKGHWGIYSSRIDQLLEKNGKVFLMLINVISETETNDQTVLDVYGFSAGPDWPDKNKTEKWFSGLLQKYIKEDKYYALYPADIRSNKDNHFKQFSEDNYADDEDGISAYIKNLIKGEKDHVQ